MSKPFGQLRNQLLESIGLLESYTCYDKKVRIGKDFSVTIDGQRIDCDAQSLEEARTYVNNYIRNTKLIEEINTTVPEEKVAHYIGKFHNVEKITDTLVESYIELASSNIFSVDPVVSAIKQRSAVTFSGKLEYKLNDGSMVAISEDLQESLNKLLQNHNEIVDYMRESKSNFMHVVRRLEE